MAIEKRELLRAVGGVLGGIQIDSDAPSATMQALAMSFNDRSASASVMRNSSLRSGAFSKRDRVGCEARSSPAIGSRPTSSLWIGSQANRAASLASSYPNAMAMTRCVINSCNSCCTLPACRLSLRQPANAEVSPKRRSAACSRIAPPSELPCRWSNFATTGRSKISGKRRQSVVVCSDKRRPHFWSQICLDNGFVP